MKIERRWQLYEEHAQKAKEEEEKRKAHEKDEREKRMRRREKIFQILQKREEGKLKTNTGTLILRYSCQLVNVLLSWMWFQQHSQWGLKIIICDTELSNCRSIWAP